MPTPPRTQASPRCSEPRSPPATQSSSRGAFHDRLHEPYRAGDAPLLGAIRASATDGAVGVTLSGSGPSVVVWAAHDRAADVAAQLRETLSDDTRVLPLRVAQRGARLA